MVKLLKVFLGLFLAVFLMSASVHAGAVVGEGAPEFSASDTNGQNVSLASYKGKYVVLEWFNSDCPFVKKHYGSGNMQKLQKAYTNKGVVWLSICSSAPGKQGNYSAEQTNAMMAEKGSRATAVILDESGDIGHLYDAKTTPHLFIINPEGKLIYQGAIDSVAGVDPAEIAAAENYVVAALEAAMVGKPVAVSATKSYGCSVKY